VDAADVDPVLWDMNSELLSLRRQLSELRQTLHGRETQLTEAKQGSEVSERAISTLKMVLTDMVRKARVELATDRDDAVRAMTERVAAAQAEADGLVADAAAALTTALSRPAAMADVRATAAAQEPPFDRAAPAAPAAPAHPSADRTDPAPDPTWAPTDLGTGPPAESQADTRAPNGRSRPSDSGEPWLSRLPETPWPVGWVPPYGSVVPPPAPPPWPFDDGAFSPPGPPVGGGLPSYPPPPAPPAPDATPPVPDPGPPSSPLPSWPPPATPPTPPPGGDTFASLSATPDLRAAVNGWAGPPSALQTLDRELDDQFEQIVALPPYTEFKTPPRGTPVYDATAAPATPDVVTEAPAAEASPAALAQTPADADFEAFWPFSREGRPAPAPGRSHAQGRLQLGLIDALLPIIAVTLIVIVVLSWMG